MIVLPGDPPKNLWDSVEEFEARMEEGRELADRLFPGDKKWKVRVVRLSISLSPKAWYFVQGLSADVLARTVEKMIAAGFPGDTV